MKKEIIGNATLYLADCFDIMPKMADQSVDIIMTDPPYCNVVRQQWDIFKSLYDYQSFVTVCRDEFWRILKNNGSFYWFGDEKNIAYSQVIFDQCFNLINPLVWHKICTLCKKGVRRLRSYATMTERILFYDKGERKSGLAMVHNRPDCFKSIKNYMRGEKEKVKKAKGLNDKQFNDYVNKLTGTKSVVSKHYFSDSQYVFPTAENYKKLQKSGFFKRPYDGMKGEYCGLKEEYQSLRAEYENLRRPWTPDKKAEDVLYYPTVPARYHETQKPEKLIRYLLERSSRSGQTVFDPFMGSGTTGVACSVLGLNFIGIEREQRYFDAACFRIEQSIKESKRHIGNV